MKAKRHSHSIQTLDQLIDDLRSSRLRVTEPRVAILETLIQGHGPFTVEEIHQKVPKKACDLATIYRTLGSLEKANLIRRCEFGDGIARYEISAHKDHHHHHAICKICKRVEVLDDCKLPELNHFAEKLGFSEVSHSLEFFGICPNCKK